LYALGIGNGGVFLGNYVKSMVESFGLKFSAIALMNTGIWHANFNSKSNPAVLFVCMSRNGHLCLHNNRTMNKLQSNGVHARQIAVDPMPLTSTTFSQEEDTNPTTTTSDGLSRAESSVLYDVLRNHSYLWPANSLLLVDPSQTRHIDDIRGLAERALPAAIPSKDDMESKNSAILQLLRIAWGFKETVYEAADGMADWFEAHPSRAK
jgi:hypothetical protein